MSLDENIPLVHAWLKSNHLLKTARTLETEYGKKITVSNGISLDQVFAIKTLFGQVMSFGYSSQNNSETSLKTSTEKKITPDITTEKLPPKKKKPRSIPRTEMYFPKMEGVLESLFEKTKYHTPNCNIDDLMKKPIDDTKSPLNNDVIELVFHPPFGDDSNFSDKDLESDSESSKTRKTIVKLSNGLTFQSPFVDDNLESNKDKQKSLKKEKEVKSENGGTDGLENIHSEITKKKKKKKSKSFENENEITTKTVQKEEEEEKDTTEKVPSKKKKKRKIVVEEEIKLEKEDKVKTNSIVESDENHETVKKKKKKKHVNDEEIEETKELTKKENIINSEDISKTKKKKKKDKKLDDVEKEYIEVSKSHKKKKKKKNRDDSSDES